MPNLKTKATEDTLSIEISSLFTEEEMKERDQDYNTLSDTAFRDKYGLDYAFKPILLSYNGQTYNIQYNFCSDTYCSFYGAEQEIYGHRTNSKRYKIWQTKKNYGKLFSIQCVFPPNEQNEFTRHGNTTTLYSNEGIAHEIKRLILANSIVDLPNQTVFHHPGCINSEYNPMNHKQFFSAYGKSGSNSPRFKCKACGRVKNILPDMKDSYNYGQQRNDILMDLIKLITMHTPVSQICGILNISPTTFYSKLEVLHERCLMFLEKHEAEQFKKISMNELWLASDYMVYNLNLIRKRNRGNGEHKIYLQKEKRPQTYILGTAEMNSGYVLRSDILYDYNYTYEMLEKDTETFHYDHTIKFLVKNDRLIIPYAPQIPTPLDSQTMEEFEHENKKFIGYKKFIDGVHTQDSYTAFAHHFLIRNQSFDFNKINQVNFVSDKSYSLMIAAYKIFMEEFKANKASYYVSILDKYQNETKKLEAYGLLIEELKEYAYDHDLDESENIKEIALHKISNMVANSGCLVGDTNTKSIQITHPLPKKNEGSRRVSLESKKEDIDLEQLAIALFKTSTDPINRYFKSIRSHIQLLEKADGNNSTNRRNYQYINFNPKYAHFILTIHRTLYNFCQMYPKQSDKKTPAMKLGIAKKVYDFTDIIYPK